MVDLDALERLHEAATPGPWFAGSWMGRIVNRTGKVERHMLFGEIPPGRCPNCNDKAEPCPVTDADGNHVHEWTSDGEYDWHQIGAPNGVTICGNYDYEQGGIASMRADRDLIVQARNALPDLLRELRAARKIVEAARAWHKAELAYRDALGTKGSANLWATIDACLPESEAIDRTREALRAALSRETTGGGE
jgi:hypothetical protein